MVEKIGHEAYCCVSNGREAIKTCQKSEPDIILMDIQLDGDIDGIEAINQIKDFIYRVLPKKYINGKHVTDRGRLLVDTEYITPDKLLKTDPLFNSLKSDIC